MKLLLAAKRLRNLLPAFRKPSATISYPAGDTSMVRKALEIISKESEIPISDLKDDT